MKVFVCNQEVITKFSSLYWGVIEVAASASLRVRVYCSCGKSEGLTGSRVLEGAHCRCCNTEWSCRIVLVKILHSVEGKDVEQACLNLEIIFPYLRLLISLSLTCVYISCMLLLFISICLILCSIDIYSWVVCVLTLVFNQKSHSCTSTFNLDKSWEDSPELVTGNSATLLCYTLCVCIIILVRIISFNSA